MDKESALFHFQTETSLLVTSTMVLTMAKASITSNPKTLCIKVPSEMANNTAMVLSSTKQQVNHYTKVNGKMV